MKPLINSDQYTHQSHSQKSASIPKVLKKAIMHFINSRLNEAIRNSIRDKKNKSNSHVDMKFQTSLLKEKQEKVLQLAPGIKEKVGKVCGGEIAVATPGVRDILNLKQLTHVPSLPTTQLYCKEREKRIFSDL